MKQRRSAMVQQWMRTPWYCDDTVGRLVGKPKMRDMIVIECGGVGGAPVNEIRVRNATYFVGAHTKCELESSLHVDDGKNKTAGGAYTYSDHRPRIYLI